MILKIDTFSEQLLLLISRSYNRSFMNLSWRTYALFAMRKYPNNSFTPLPAYSAFIIMNFPQDALYHFSDLNLNALLKVHVLYSKFEKKWYLMTVLRIPKCCGSTYHLHALDFATISLILLKNVAFFVCHHISRASLFPCPVTLSLFVLLFLYSFFIYFSSLSQFAMLFSGFSAETWPVPIISPHNRILSFSLFPSLSTHV